MMLSRVRDVSRLRVAHLIESDGPGGAERVVAQLATALQAEGVSNVAFLPARGEGWLARQLEGSGVTVEHFHIERPVSPACARSLAAAFRRHRIAVAHSHEFTMAVYGAWAARLAGSAHLITMHGSRYYAERLRRRLAMRAAVAMSGRTVAVSTELAAQLRRDLGVPAGRIETIPNGVPVTAPAATAIRQELGLAGHDRLLVAVGNLYPVKGHCHLIDALAILSAGHPNVHLAICGRGNLAGQLAVRACERGLAGRVHLLGLRSDVAGILAAADVFVMPSLAEGLPLALLEAMFASAPIVASDVGEVAAALDRGRAGLLVPPADPAALASAIALLLTDPVLARDLGERGRRRAAAEYALSRMVRRYVTAYAAMLEGAQDS